jgi:signal peptidase I
MQKAKTDLRRELFEWGQALVSAITVFIMIFAFVIRIIGVEQHSMEPTLNEGDKMLVSNIFYTPSRGDIIMFTKKGLALTNAGDSPLVKRVIAIGGDTIDINFYTGEVFINNRVIHEPYIKDLTVKRDDVEFPLVVPKGHVFVMGDNRGISLDSRSSRVGVVDNRYILGRVYMRIYPFNKIGTVK